MNRENLFKAKTTKKENPKHVFSESWVEGNLILCNGKAYIHPISNKVAVKGELGKIIVMHEVIPDTICRYTGLEDKNGKEIWGNDILRGHKNNDDLVRVAFGEFNVIDVDTLETVDRVVGWHTEVIETDALSKCEPFCLPMPLTDFYIEISEFEVFGNIFDNPELLEVE
ncbi:YopX family protein [Faecalimonas umbilicata]|jgi:uncharacterized phage protein (TIGR01671 family)|uniref:YopX family protein n=1 Tax=Faecalimonas umbilicata TaxID=1912855 RepID=UPI002A827EAE|nr:YopX family protein [Faecalimonas umbilicata]MDY4597921.1 YopX family protein [Faecalimonas umbilicata]